MLNALDLFNHNTTMMDTLQVVIEFIGTFAFAISGIRQAAARNSIGLAASFVALRWPLEAVLCVMLCWD